MKSPETGFVSPGQEELERRQGLAAEKSRPFGLKPGDVMVMDDGRELEVVRFDTSGPEGTVDANQDNFTLSEKGDNVKINSVGVEDFDEEAMMFGGVKIKEIRKKEESEE